MFDETGGYRKPHTFPEANCGAGIIYFPAKLGQFGSKSIRKYSKYGASGIDIFDLIMFLLQNDVFRWHPHKVDGLITTYCPHHRVLAPFLA